MAKLFSVEDMRQAKPDSPRISHLSWGRIEVEGHLSFKDAKIFPGDGNGTGVKRAHVMCPSFSPSSSRIDRARRKDRCTLKRGLGATASLSRNPRGLVQERTSKSKSCRPRLLWSALTSSVKTSRSAVYSILHAEQPRVGVLGDRCERLTLIKRREVYLWRFSYIPPAPTNVRYRE
jgi:hypothetical protein